MSPTDDAPRAEALSGSFARVTIANFLFFLSFVSFFLLPLHVKALGGSETTVGLVVGSAGISALLFLPLIGSGIDRVGGRRFFVAGCVAMTAASLGYLFVDSIGPLLYFLRVVQGVSFAAAFTAATTMAANLAPPDRRARALGIFGISTLLTHAIAPTLGEEVVRRGGFPALFVMAAGFTILALPIVAGVRAGTAASRPIQGTRWRMSPAQRVVLATIALTGIGFGAVITFVPTYVTTHDLGRVAFFYASYSVAALLARIGGAGLSDTFGRRETAIPALAALAAAIVALAGVESALALAGAAALFGVAQGINYPTLQALLVDLTPPEHLGRSQAFFNGAFNLGVMVAAFSFGTIVDAFGHRSMFVVAATLPLAAGALLYARGAGVEVPSRAPGTPVPGATESGFKT